jgi:antitoxin component of MazEF toxin-antitoxin module
LDLKAGDGVIFMLEGDHIVMVPVKRRSLTDLRGALRVDKRLSREDERRAVHAHVARHAMGVTLDDAEC